MMSALKDLEGKIGYSFTNKELLTLAVTHPSFNEHNKDREDNQRMEFLGDSILSAVLSNALFHLYPAEDEGALSRKRAVLVRGSSLSKIASTLQIQDFLLMSKAEINNHGYNRSSTLEDAIEAIVGAIYLDGGIDAAAKCILNWFGDLKSKVDQEHASYNPKGQLQEILQEQENKSKIVYRLTKEEGPPHKKSFQVDLILGKKTLGTGKGKSKKEAEEEAATKALLILQKNGKVDPE
jgi:ribonuclease III